MKWKPILTIPLLITFTLVWLLWPWGIADALWYDANWNYRQTVTITNNGSEKTNYALQVIIDTATLITATKMQSDCDDARFATTDGVELSYFLEVGCNSANTVFWVEVPTIPAGSSSIYFYYDNPSATSASSFIDPAGSINIGNGADGAIVVSGSQNLNTATLSSGRSCGDGGDAVNYRVTANTSSGQDQITLSTTPSSGCLAVGDEVLIINLMGTSGNNASVGQYETARITSIATATLTLNHNLINSYDGSTQQIMVQRVPNYTNVTVCTSSGNPSGSCTSAGTITASAFDGNKGGVIFFRGNGTVNIASSGTITANDLGYRGGSGGSGNTSGGVGGNNGESYDGQVGKGSSGSTNDASVGGGKSGNNTTAAVAGGTRGGGGGGGSDGSGNGTNGGGGAGAGGGYAGGGGGGGANSDSAVNGGGGGSGATSAGTAGGGGAGACRGTGTPASGANAGSAGSASTCGTSNGNGGAVGSGATTGGGGGGSGNSAGSGAGGGGGGIYGTSTLSTLFYGSAGGGGGGGDGSGRDGQAGGNGGGIIYIGASTITVSGTVTANGATGTDGSTGGGGGGGGAGGSVYLNGSTVTLGSSLVSATGGSTSSVGTRIAGGGAGSIGRIYAAYSSTSGSTNPSATTAALPIVSSVGTEQDRVGSGEPTPTPPPGNYLTFWKMDEGHSDTINDSSGNGKSGTRAGSTKPSWQTDDQCISGKCLYFDGTSSSVTVGSSIGSVKSVSMWVKPVSVSSGAIIDLNGSARVTVSSGTISATGFTSPTIYVNGHVSSTLTANQWQHVTVTTGTAISGSAVKLGNYSSTYLRGFIDEVQTFNYALSAAAVKTVFSRSGASRDAARFGYANNDFLYQGLVGYWKMDESAANTCAGGVNDSCDSSGMGHDGAWNGDATASAGKFGGGVTFDGTGDYTRITHTSSLQLTTNFTIATWVNPDALTQEALVCKGNSAADPDYLLLLNRSGAASNNIAFYNGTSWIDSNAEALSGTGSWAHVAVTYDNSAYTLYVNGVSVGSTAGSGSIQTSTNDLWFGIQCATNGNTFDGILDETRIYNRALSSKEVEALYNWAPGPVGHWKMDENTGSTAEDSSGNENTGTWNGTGERWSNGKVGPAGIFNGTADYVNIPQNSIFDFGANQDFTVAAWVKTNQGGATNSWPVIIGKENRQSTRQGYNLILHNETSNGLAWYFEIYVNGSAFQCFGPSNIADGTWHHIAGIRSGSNLLVYQDGVYSQTCSGSSGSTAKNIPLRFGVAGNDADYYQGQLDDVRIYNYARTAAQVIEDMNGGHPVVGSPVGSAYGYWKFDEGADNTCSGGTNDACNSGYGGTTLDGAQTGMAVPATANSGWNNSGVFHKALSFDGTDDRVSVGDMPGTEGATQITWSFWTKPTTLAADRCIFCKVNTPNGSPTQASWGIKTGATSSIIRAIVTSSNTAVSTYGESPSGTLVNGTWAHVVVVYDGTQATNGNRIKMYVNGKPVTVTTTGTIPTTGPAASTSNATFGSSSNNASGTQYSGTLDEAKVYLAALTPDQVLTEFNRGKSAVMGSTSTASDGITADNSAAREYCIPGDTTSCSVPLRHYPMNENTGNTIFNIAASGNPATFTGTSAPTWVTGKIGSGLNFDGVNDYVTLPNLGAINDYSISFWVSPNYTINSVTVGNDTIWGKTAGTGADVWIEWAGSGDGEMRFRCFNASGDDMDTTTTTWTKDTWYHITATYTHSTTTRRIYVNGVLENTKSTANCALTSHANGSRLGDDTSSSWWLDARLDDFRVYDYVRTPAQVAWEFNRGGPVAHYKMDECQGTTIYNAARTGSGAAAGMNGTLTIGGSGTQTTAGTCSTSGAWFNGATGKFNAAMNFDGTDDYISVTDPGTSSLLDFGAGAQISISAWIKPSSDLAADEYRTIVVKGWTAGNDNGNYWFGVGKRSGNNVMGLCFKQASSSIRCYYTTTNIITPNAWQHVVLTHTFGTGSSTRIYKDGILQPGSWVDSATGNETPTENNDPLWIGADYTTGPDELFHGLIDDVRIFNYPLTELQIRAVMSGSAVSFQ